MRMRKKVLDRPPLDCCRVFHLSMRFACVFIICYTAIFKYSLASNDHGQGQMISSSLAGRAACAGEDVTLTCAVLGTGRLTWVINSSANTILFNLEDDSSLTTQTDSTGQFTASLIHYSRHLQYYFLGNLTSTLHTIVNPSLMEYPINILCYYGISNSISVPSYIEFWLSPRMRLSSPDHSPLIARTRVLAICSFCRFSSYNTASGRFYQPGETFMTHLTYSGLCCFFIIF